MAQRYSSLALIFAVLVLSLVTCASPAVVPATSIPSTSTIIPTDTSIPTPGTLANCKRVPGRIQQACASPGTGLGYWAYVPSEPGDATKGLPLLIYLHGSDRRGSMLDLLYKSGPLAGIETGRTLAMMVISPQCPYSDNWQYPEMVERLSRFVHEMVETYQLDPSRVYLTGFSMGGDGVWAVAQAHPDQFAALLPVASDWYPHDPADMCVLQDIPIWVFQSEKDELVDPKYAKNNVEYIQVCGGTQIQLTLLSSGGHEETSRQAYAMDEVYQWLLEQTLP